MRRTIYINIIRRTLLTLCLMVSATMTWADNVAKIGSTEYATLQAAIDAATNGQTVTLLMDISTGTDSYSIAKQITIDLGGKTITASHTTYNDKLFAITSGGKLTITGEGTITDNDVRGIFYNEGNLTIESGTFTTTNNDGYAVIYNTGSTAFCSVKGGTFTGAYAAVYNTDNATMSITNGTFDAASIVLVTQDVATLNISGGTIENSGNVILARRGTKLNVTGGTITAPNSGNYQAIEVRGENTIVSISGGNISGYNGITVWDKANLTIDGDATISGTNLAISGNATEGGTTITINGGTITNDNDVAIYHPQSGSLTINGGTITGVGGIEMKAGSLEVGAGAVITATGTPTHVINDGGTSTLGYAIAIVENGNYAGVSTVNINPGAEINGPVAVVKDSEKKPESPEIVFSDGGLQMAVKVTDNTDNVVGQFQSVELAVENAPVGATVTLLDNNSLTSTIVTTKNYTLDLNGKTLTSDGQRALWIKSGDVIIKSTITDPVGTISVPATASSTESAIRVGSDEAAASLTVKEGVTITAEESVAISVEGQNTETSSLIVNGAVTGKSGIEIKGGSLTVGSSAVVAATGTPSHIANNTGTSSCGYSIATVENDVNGKKVTSVNIDNAATLTGPVAQLYDSEVTDFAPNYTGKYTIKVASIEKDKYFTLKDAYNIVPTSGTVKLLGDLTLSETLAMDIEKTCTLDLNGKTLTGNNCAAIQISHGHVTLDGAENSKVTVSGAPTAAIQLGKTDTGENRNVSLTINNNVVVTSDVSTGVLLSGTNTRETLEVKGTITTSGTDHIAIKAEDEVAKIHVDKTTGIVTANNAMAIYQANTGELVVDGKVTGTDGIKMYGGNLKVSKDAIITGTNYAIAIVEKENCAGVGKANISNEANITGVIACLVESQNINAAEPIFSGDITMVAETPNSNGFGEKYVKLEDAITAAAVSTAEKESVVKLLEDITVSAFVPISKAITLDMDDYSIIGKQTSGATLTIGANVTLKNGGISSDTEDGISIGSGTVALKNMTVSTTRVSLRVSGGKVTADTKSSFSSSNNNTVVLSGGSLTIEGKVLNTSTSTDAITASAGDLTIESTATVSSATSKAINWASTGNLTINGGKIAGAEAVYASAGKVTIDGGTFTGKNHGVEIAGYTELPAVNGGTFICGTSSKPITAASATGFVKGDYFSDKIDQTICYAGYMVSTNKKNNGMYYLVNEIVIYDGTDWNAPSNIPFTIATARYIRNTGMGTTGTTFGTLCLPFSYSVSQTNMTFYKVESIDGDVLNLTHYTGDTNGNVPANTPVIFQFTEKTTSFEIISNNASVSVTQPAEPSNQGDLAGTFVQKTIKSGLGNIYYLNSDAFHQATQSVTVPAYRAYIYYPSSNPNPAKPAVLYIHTDDEDVDSIDTVFENNNVEAIYDLQGRKQNNLQRGLNIIKMANGKTLKVYVK